MQFKIGDLVYCFKSFFPESDTKGYFYVQRIDYKSNVVRVGHHPEPLGGYANGIPFELRPHRLRDNGIYRVKKHMNINGVDTETIYIEDIFHYGTDEQFGYSSHRFMYSIKAERLFKLKKLCGPNTLTNSV